jgi:hypothetical protein
MARCIQTFDLYAGQKSLACRRLLSEQAKAAEHRTALTDRLFTSQSHWSNNNVGSTDEPKPGKQVSPRDLGFGKAFVRCFQPGHQRQGPSLPHVPTPSNGAREMTTPTISIVACQSDSFHTDYLHV